MIDKDTERNNDRQRYRVKQREAKIQRETMTDNDTERNNNRNRDH